MKTSPVLIFDRALGRRRLARAAASGKAEDFLLARAADELCERLAAVKRTFAAILDCGTPSARLALSLAGQLRPRLLVRMAPLKETCPRTLLSLVGDEENLALAPERFDLAVCALSLQNLNDLPGALLQLRRVLKPDGLFLGCLLGGATLTELRKALEAAEAELCGGVSPRVAPFADVRDLGALLQRAGFALPVADSDPVTIRYANMFALMADLRAMGGANALAARRRKPVPKSFFLRAAEAYAERFSDPDGRVRATFEMIFLSGWAPHESQQKPLAPGSAQMRLADALAAQAANR